MIAKVTIFCVVLVAVNASVLLSAPLVSTGISSSVRKQDGMGNYAFNYGIADGIGATNARAESGDAHGNKVGTYTITDIDGRARRVDYVADAAGFRASVKTNEPGTALSAPAAALINSPYAPPVAPAVPAVKAAVPAIAPIGLSPLAVAPSVSAYSSVIGHGAVLGAPLGAGIIGAPLGLGLGAGMLGKSLLW